MPIILFPLIRSFGVFQAVQFIFACMSAGCYLASASERTLHQHLKGDRAAQKYHRKNYTACRRSALVSALLSYAPAGRAAA